MKKALKILVLFLLCSSGSAMAQGVVYSSDSNKAFVQPTVYVAKPKPPKAPKQIVHELSFGYRFNSNGWSLYTDCGRVKTRDIKRSDMFHNVLFWQLELTEKKHPKEESVTSAYPNKLGGSSTYKYGKINNFYALKFGGGFQKLLAGKPDPECISIHWVNTAGFSLGLLKPYYLNVTSSGSQAIKYSDITQSDFLDAHVIAGHAGFSKGLDEITFIPGGHIKTALHFDFAANKKTILSVETGVNAEFYSTPVQLMANQNPVSAFYDFFIAFQFGKRW